MLCKTLGDSVEKFINFHQLKFINKLLKLYQQNISSKIIK